MMGAEKVVKLERGRDTRRLLGEAPGGAEAVGGPQPILLHAQAVPGTMNRPLVWGKHQVCGQGDTREVSRPLLRPLMGGAQVSAVHIVQ